MTLLPPAAPSLLTRRPTRALAEAMGATTTCMHGPCPTLLPLWPDLARALSSGAPVAVVHGLAGAATHAAHACHLDCPAVAALRDISALVDAEARDAEPVVSAA